MRTKKMKIDIKPEKEGAFNLGFEKTAIKAPERKKRKKEKV